MPADPTLIEKATEAVRCSHEDEIHAYLDGEVPVNAWRPERYAQAVLDVVREELLSERAVQAGARAVARYRAITSDAEVVEWRELSNDVREWAWKDAQVAIRTALDAVTGTER